MPPPTKPDPMLFVYRFLCYGNEFPSYCPKFTKFTLAKIPHVKELIEDDKRATEIVKEINRVSQENRSINRRAVIFALAACAHSTCTIAKHEAFKILPQVLRDGGELFAFVDFSMALSQPTKGWGRGQRNSIRNWYKSKSAVELAIMVSKIMLKHKWSHRDVLKLIHPKTADEGNRGNVYSALNIKVQLKVYTLINIIFNASILTMRLKAFDKSF